jgi:glycerol-1-phosphatase
LDVSAAPADVITSSQAAASVVAELFGAGARVLPVGGPGVAAALRAAGLTVVDDAEAEPVAVVQGYGPRVGLAELSEAVVAIRNGARHVATNTDATIPSPRGPLPGNGSMVTVVSTVTGQPPLVTGKPDPAMHAECVRRTNARRPLVVGDRLDTDLAGARSGGYPGLHVLTGVNSARDDILAHAGERPDFIGADLRSLLEPHPLPVQGDEGWWTCREASARVAGDQLELRAGSAGSDPVDLVRAACSAAWAHVDAGGSLDPASVPELVVPGAPEA